MEEVDDDINITPQMVWVLSENMTIGMTYRVNALASEWVYKGVSNGNDSALKGWLWADYKGHLHALRPRKEVLEVTDAKENTMTIKKLYEITTDNQLKYGHKLAVDSSGNWVMEIKGSGVVDSFNKSAITEVVPYSVAIKFSGGLTDYHYLASKGDWAVDDIVIVTGSSNLATVIRLDVKSTKATKWLTGFKLQGTFIKSGE